MRDVMVLGQDQSLTTGKILKSPKEPKLVLLLPETQEVSSWRLPEDIMVVSAVGREPPKLTKIAEFYRKNAIDIAKLPPVPMLAVGRAIFAVTKSQDFTSWRQFVDTAGTDGNRLWANDRWVYPVPSLDGDSFARWWFWVQEQYARMSEKPQWNKDLRTVVLDKESVKTFFRERKEQVVAVDLETHGFDPWSQDAEILCVSFSVDGVVGYVVPWADVAKQDLENFLRGKKLVGANLKFDIRWFVVCGGLDRAVFSIHRDTVVSSHVINESAPHGLKAEVWKYTPFGGYDRDLSDFRDRFPRSKSFKDLPKRMLFEYAAKDSALTYRVFLAHEEVLKSWRVESSLGWTPYRYYTEIVIPAQNAYLDFELRGVCFDWDRLAGLSCEVQEKVRLARENLIATLGCPADLNVDSTMQLREYIEKVLGWPKFATTKGGEYQVSRDAFVFWGQKGHTKEVEAYMQYRQAKDLQKTFVGDPAKRTGFWKYRKRDGRLHSTYACMLAKSGRNRSREPNLQNIGNQKWFEKFKSCFTTPDESYVLVEFDAVGLQLRQGAVASGDKAMTEAFKRGEDLHAKTAQAVLARDLSLEEFLVLAKDSSSREFKLRKKAKGINFSLLFGASAYAFAKTSIAKTWSGREASEYIKENGLAKRFKWFLDAVKTSDAGLAEGDRRLLAKYWTVADSVRGDFFEMYPGLRAWHEVVQRKAKIDGYVISCYGAVRRLPELLVEEVTKHDLNISLNSPIQNWEACYMNQSVCDLVESLRGLRSWVCANIHDAFLMYIHKDEISLVGRLIREAFHKMRDFNQGVPFVVEARYCDPRQGGIWAFKGMRDLYAQEDADISEVAKVSVG